LNIRENERRKRNVNEESYRRIIEEIRVEKEIAKVKKKFDRKTTNNFISEIANYV
jgi:hypothetical protein